MRRQPSGLTEVSDPGPRVCDWSPCSRPAMLYVVHVCIHGELLRSTLSRLILYIHVITLPRRQVSVRLLALTVLADRPLSL